MKYPKLIMFILLSLRRWLTPQDIRLLSRVVLTASPFPVVLNPSLTEVWLIAVGSRPSGTLTTAATLFPVVV